MSAEASKLRKLVEIQAKYKKCRECPLHENRRTGLVSYGNPASKVVFVVDRLSPLEVTSGDFLVGTNYLSTLGILFDYLGKKVDDFYFTPLVACPTTKIPSNLPKEELARIEHVPLPKNKELEACAKRLHEEIHLLEPRLIVAFGQLAAKALIKKDTPSLHYNLNEIHEGSVKGDFIDYPVPVLLTYSLHTLLTNPDTEDGGIWHKTALAIHKAIEIATFMEELTWDGYC